MESQTNSIVVWIIEDHDAYRENLAKLIASSPGMKCAGCFASCEDALTALATVPRPNVILLDIGLPGMSGLDGIRRFKERSTGIEIVILTSFEDDEKILRVIYAGSSGYLLKTSTEEEILKGVRDVFQGGSSMSPQVARRVLSLFPTVHPPRNDYSLTQRETEILHLIVAGMTKRQIAARLFLSSHTVDHHLRNIYYKLQVHNRSSAIAKALREHLL
jgi:DNA-binding NarL/FixJ family response regulator